ncbi:MAG TPA: DegQ family serine endoprotease [Woeseiaceae bacterium]|nr:DegQ family serine endoprotease [Woeseiaceae bacterium]
MNRWTFSRRLAAVLTALAAAASVMALSIASNAADSGKSLNEPRAVFDAPANERSFADVVEQVRPAVVDIRVTKTAQALPTNAFRSFPGGRGKTPFDNFFDHFFGVPGMPPRSAPMKAQGSGFVIGEGGYVVTNNHVIDGADKIVVAAQNGRQYQATLVGTDPKTDIALLKIDDHGKLPSLEFGDSDRARVGDWVLAIGNPFGLGGTATAGIISARGRDIHSGPYDDFLQIDAPINSGNSGGPVFNADGDVIGMNTAIFSPNGGNVGIGFAIPSRQIIEVVDSLKSTGTVRRGWLGVQVQDVSDDMAASFSLEDATGALVADIVDDSPADKAGLTVGDVILQFDGQNVDDAHALSRIVADTAPKHNISVKVWRDGREKTLRVRLGEAAQESAAASTPGSQSSAAGLGLGLVDLTDEYRARLGLPEDYSGVVITDVAPDSAAAEEGLRPGDAISRVDSHTVRNVDDAVRALRDAKEHDDHVTLLVRRGDAQQFVSVAFS